MSINAKAQKSKIPTVQQIVQQIVPIESTSSAVCGAMLSASSCARSAQTNLRLPSRAPGSLLAVPLGFLKRARAGVAATAMHAR